MKTVLQIEFSQSILEDREAILRRSGCRVVSVLGFDEARAFDLVAHRSEKLILMCPQTTLRFGRGQLFTLPNPTSELPRRGTIPAVHLARRDSCQRPRPPLRFTRWVMALSHVRTTFPDNWFGASALRQTCSISEQCAGWPTPSRRKTVNLNKLRFASRVLFSLSLQSS